MYHQSTNGLPNEWDILPVPARFLGDKRNKITVGPSEQVIKYMLQNTDQRK